MFNWFRMAIVTQFNFMNITVYYLFALYFNVYRPKYFPGRLETPNFKWKFQHKTSTKMQTATTLCLIAFSRGDFHYTIKYHMHTCHWKWKQKKFHFLMHVKNHTHFSLSHGKKTTCKRILIDFYAGIDEIEVSQFVCNRVCELFSLSLPIVFFCHSECISNEHFFFFNERLTPRTVQTLC